MRTETYGEQESSKSPCVQKRVPRVQLLLFHHISALRFSLAGAKTQGWVRNGEPATVQRSREGMGERPGDHSDIMVQIDTHNEASLPGKLEEKC